MLEDVLPCKTTITVNASAVKVASTFLSRGTLKPDACTYRNTTDNCGNASAFCGYYSIKLHSTAYSLLIQKEWKQCHEIELLGVFMRYRQCKTHRPNFFQFSK